jgi:hypothetical protein
MQNFGHNIGFREKSKFFAENWQKSRKIVTITSTLNEFVKKIAHNVAQPIFWSQIIRYLYLRKMSKPSLIGRKSSQSGHPDSDLHFPF